MAQWPIMSTLDVPLDPIIDAQVIEPVPSLRKVSVSHRNAHLLRLLLQERSERLEVPRQLILAVIAVTEIHEVLRDVSSCPPHRKGLEAETLYQLVKRLMVAIDELAAPLADHTIRPGGSIRMHPTADTIGCLVDTTRETGVLQSQSRVKSGDSRSNDG